MVELAAIVTALILAGAAWSAVRVVRGIARVVGGWRGRSPGAVLGARRLRASRAVLQAQADRIDALAAALQRARAQQRLAERERDLLRERGQAADDRFPRAKRAFALRFHPDRVPARGLEGTLRRALFQEYWAILQRIERG